MFSPQLLSLLEVEADHLEEAARGEVLVHDVPLHHSVPRRAVEFHATEGTTVASHVLVLLLLHHLHLGLLHLPPLLLHLCFHCFPLGASAYRHLQTDRYQVSVVTSAKLFGLLNGSWTGFLDRVNVSLSLFYGIFLFFISVNW